MTIRSYMDKMFPGAGEVIVMAWPIVLGTLSFTFMTFVDQYMVAKLGTAQFAAVGNAGLWSYTLGTLFFGTIGCVTTFVAQSLGKGQRENCARYAWQGIYASAGLGMLAVALWFVSDRMFASMGHAPEVARLESEYFKIRLLGYIFIGMTTSLASFFQSISHPRIPMYASFVGNIVNVVLDYALIFGAWGFPRLEMAGAAIATVIALGIQTIVMMAIYLAPSYNEEFQTRSTWRFDPVKTWELLRIGWPAGMTSFADIFNWAIFTGFIVGGFGTVSLAAHNAAMNLIHISFMPCVGLNAALATIVGQWIGRGDIHTAKERTYTGMKIAIIFMTFIGIFLAAFGPFWIRTLFSKDAEVIRLGSTLLLLCALFQAFDAVNITVLGGLRGAGDTRYMLGAIMVTGYGVFLPIALFLALDHIPVFTLFGMTFGGFPFGMGMRAVGAWTGATVYIIVLSGVLFMRFHGEKWRHIRIFDADRKKSDAS